MQSRQTDADRGGACYVFFRIFPGLREPCDLARYVTLPDAEINTAMEADAARWLDENRAQVMEKLRKQSQQRMEIGSYRNKPRSAPAVRSFTFPVIARIADWTYRECFSIGVGHGWWASARFPILVAANERDAADICDGLNHRHREHPHPDSPRFGWLPASAFPHDEQLDIGAKIVEAQAGMIHGEAAAAIHSLAAEAVVFHESLQRSHLPAGPKDKGDDPDQMVSPENIAKRYGFTSKDKDRLRKRLEAWRKPENCTEWTEVQDRKPRQPRYLYRLGSVQHLVNEVKGTG